VIVGWVAKALAINRLPDAVVMRNCFIWASPLICSGALSIKVLTVNQKIKNGNTGEIAQL